MHAKYNHDMQCTALVCEFSITCSCSGEALVVMSECQCPFSHSVCWYVCLLVCLSVGMRLSWSVCGAASIPSLVGTALPSSSNFFINYVITQGIAMIPFRMMFPHIGVLVGLFRILRICGEDTPPPPFPPTLPPLLSVPLPTVSPSPLPLPQCLCIHKHSQTIGECLPAGLRVLKLVKLVNPKKYGLVLPCISPLQTCMLGAC